MLVAAARSAWRLITSATRLFSPAAAPEAEQDGPRDPIAFFYFISGTQLLFYFLSGTRLLFIFIWHGSSHIGYQTRYQLQLSLNTYGLTNTPQILRSAWLGSDI
jgi:hypothetical protein